MITPFLSEIQVLVVPGLYNSGPEHWQTEWQHLYPSFQRVEQLDWDTPNLEVWSEQLTQALRCSSKPTFIVAHSFGCLTTIFTAANKHKNLAGALLVAPADPEKFGVSDVLINLTMPCSSIIVASTNDPWMEVQRAEEWAKKWNSYFINAGALGHINGESGLGDWLYGFSLLQKLIAKYMDSGIRV